MKSLIIWPEAGAGGGTDCGDTGGNFGSDRNALNLESYGASMTECTYYNPSNCK